MPRGCQVPVTDISVKKPVLVLIGRYTPVRCRYREVQNRFRSLPPRRITAPACEARPRRPGWQATAPLPRK